MTRKVFKTGHSLAVTLSKKVLREIGLKAGDAVELEVGSDKEKAFIRKARKNSQQALNLKIRHKLGENGRKK